MAPELLDIQPRELNFLFELKKQSSCTVRLNNKFNDYVAFKIKTTSPKKYCVRPNVGIIKPKSFCDFTVTMQVPKVAPPDLVCKDKFLVQSTIVPAGTTDDDITSSMFARDDDRPVEEVKLRVVLLSPLNSPILSPINMILKRDPVHIAPLLNDHGLQKLGNSIQNKHVGEDVVEAKANSTEVVKPANNIEYNTVDEVEDLADDAEYEGLEENGDYKTLHYLKHEHDPIKNGYKKSRGQVMDQEDAKNNANHKTPNHVKDEVDPIKGGEYKALKRMNHLEQSLEDVNITMKEEAKEPPKVAEQSRMDDVEVSVQELRHDTAKDINESKLVKDVGEIKSKFNVLESKLAEAEVTISKLTEERRWTGQERESLRKELALLRSKGGGDRNIQVGFPCLFVCMVAIVSIFLGYTLRC